MQAPDSSQEVETAKTSSEGAAEQEKSTTASTDGQKTDDEDKVRVIVACHGYYGSLVLC